MMANSLVQSRAAPRPLCMAGALLRLPQLWLQRHIRRREMAALDIDQIRDCGLDPEVVRCEAAKPFWRS